LLTNYECVAVSSFVAHVKRTRIQTTLKRTVKQAVATSSAM